MYEVTNADGCAAPECPQLTADGEKTARSRAAPSEHSTALSGTEAAKCVHLSCVSQSC